MSPSVTDPLSGVSMPAISLSSVLLPEPFGPISPIAWPGSTRKETWSVATTLPKRLTSCRTISGWTARPGGRAATGPAAAPEPAGSGWPGRARRGPRRQP